MKIAAGFLGGLVLRLQIEDRQRGATFTIVAAKSMELMLSSPLRPVQQVFNAVPTAPESMSEQMAQFGYA